MPEALLRRWTGGTIADGRATGQTLPCLHRASRVRAREAEYGRVLRGAGDGRQTGSRRWWEDSSPTAAEPDPRERMSHASIVCRKAA